MRSLPQVELIYARIARTRAHFAAAASLLSSRASPLSRLSLPYYFVVVTHSSSLDGWQEEDFRLFPSRTR